MIDRSNTAARLKLRQTARSFKNSRAKSETAPIAAGTIVGGVFKIESVIGEGGMGTIYLARHLTLQRQFALKVLAPDLVSEQYWLRFQSEAKTLAGLKHPNLVTVYDLGVHDKSVFYYSMDYLKGDNLEDILATEGAQTMARTIEIFLSVLDGLAYAHRNGIVHRDIKPANIFICQSAIDGSAIKILDFGIAKLVEQSATSQQLTAAGEVFGSPYYMSPEQCMGEAVDARSDIYSVGCSIFETLSGFVPFEGKSSVEISLMHEESEPPHLSELVDTVNASMDFVIEKCLAKLPRDRYQSAKELALDLERIKAGKDLSIYSRAAGNKIKNDAALEKKEPRRINFKLLVLVPIVLGAVAAASFCLFFKQEPIVAEPPLTSRPVDQFSSGLVDIIDGSPVFKSTDSQVQKFLQSKPDFYSSTQITAGRQRKVFTFPEDFSLGTISYLNQGIRTIVKAQGTVRVSEDKVDLDANTSVAENPQLLRYFKTSDLRSISIYSNAGSSQKMMAEIIKFPGIETLALARTDFRNQDFALLNKLGNLNSLSISAENPDVEALSKIKIFPQLKKLTVNCSTNISSLLRALSPENLQTLQIENANISAVDFGTIAKFKNLRSLTLINIGVSKDKLEQLISLRKLGVLYLTGLDRNDGCVDTLKNFKSLETLSLPPTFIRNNKFKIQIRKALPKLKTLDVAEIYSTAEVN